MNRCGPPYQPTPQGAGYDPPPARRPATNPEKSSQQNGSRTAFSPALLPFSEPSSSQAGGAGLAYAPIGYHNVAPQWGNQAVPPGGLGATEMAPPYGGPQQAGKFWPTGMQNGYGWNGASGPAIAADVSSHQPSWAFHRRQSQNGGVSEPRSSRGGYGFVSGAAPGAIKVEPKAEPESEFSRNGGCSGNSVSMKREVPPCTWPAQSNSDTGDLDRKTGSQSQSTWRGKAGSRSEKNNPKYDTNGVKTVAPKSSYNGSDGPQSKQGNNLTGGLSVKRDSTSDLALVSTGVNGDKMREPADVSETALVSTAKDQDMNGGGASDNEMDLDFSGGASGSEDEGGSEESFKRAVKSWKEAALKAGGGAKKVVNARGGLPCLVCRKFSNTVQDYQGFQALLQHAENREKLEPFQHAAYSTALRQIESDTEREGNELVPAKKKLRVLEAPEKVWPPVVVVENLRTGIKGGKWDGVSERDIKKAFGDQWPIRKVTEKWRGDGHTGAFRFRLELISFHCISRSFLQSIHFLCRLIPIVHSRGDV